jgi:hypothetical protein
LLNKNYFAVIAISFSLGSEIEKQQMSRSFITFAGAKFNLVQNGKSQNRYIWIHGDEQTARMALDHHIQHFEGLAFFIQNEDREIPYGSTIIDPNRLFSRTGTYHALKKFQPGWRSSLMEKALNEIDSDRDQFLDILMPAENGVLIAVHNNFRGYNVRSEEKKSQRVSIKTNENPRDFIICTDENDFEKLATGPYNVVLQNVSPEKDDGSLSWEALRRKTRYLNVETRLGYLTKQKKMLSFIEDRLN